MPYETRALQAKEQYHGQLAEYRKTAEYEQYKVYLQDFKEKHTQPQGVYYLGYFVMLDVYR